MIAGSDDGEDAAPCFFGDRRLGPLTEAVVSGVLFLGVAGCSGGPVSPELGASSRDTVVLGFRDDTTDVQLRGTESGRLIGRRVLGGFAPGTPARRGLSKITVVERTLFASLSGIDDEIDNRELIALRLPSLTVIRRAWFSDIEARLEIPVQLSEFLAVSPMGERIYLRGRRGSEDRGVAVLDGRWRGETFLGGFAGDGGVAQDGVVEVAGRGGHRLLVIAGVRSARAARLMIYEFDSLRLRDSVFVARPLQSSFGFRLQGLVRARDGRHVFVLTVDSLLEVDVRAAEVVARTRRARSNLRRPPMAVTTDPPRIFVGDRGSFDFPGSGKLQVYDAGDLDPAGTIEVAGSMTDIAVNREGDRVFVVAGTELIGGFHQRASLSVVDAGSMTRIRKFEYDRFSLKEVVAF